MPNQEIADWKIAMATSMNSSEDRLQDQGGKTGPGNRGNVMRARHDCRDGRSGGARRAHVKRPGMPVNRMETVRLPVGKSCSETVAMPVPIREPFDVM
ncbi:hypothetical protein [Burkholderia lata]|uniref:hypothetical protein n=1 Tax=Burkholderia lata (strain ATCC 17760 / DSM 23089 / LMG 22485 / NCIMB 9086 / R18194 / 383) TaxID=482957 RepID=UPI0015836EB2|nr:hypothetical protein [Burkholderia lata]